MATADDARMTLLKFDQDSHLETWAAAFLLDRQVQNLSPHTVAFYRQELRHFFTFAESQLITQITQITPDTVRMYLLWLEEQGHNPGGRHAAFRALRAFLYWWENELEPKDWKNPIKKVKAPRVKLSPLDPVERGTIDAMLGTCQKGDFYGDRDRALIMALGDTGARAREMLKIDRADVNQATGAVQIRTGKGGKSRTVFLGRGSRKALRSYLKHRKDPGEALWITRTGERLSYGGLRGMLARRAKLANVPAPTAHEFRRYFALTMLRNGVDIYSIQEMMGHADLTVLKRYLKQTEEDLRRAHAKGRPMDGSGLK